SGSLPFVESWLRGYDNPYLELPSSSSSLDDTPSVALPSLQQLQPIQPPFNDRVMEESEILQLQQRQLVVGMNSTSSFVNYWVNEGSKMPPPLKGCCGIENKPMARFVLRATFISSLFHSILAIIVLISSLHYGIPNVQVEVAHLYIPNLATAMLFPGAARALYEMNERRRGTSAVSFLIKSMYVYMVILGIYSSCLVYALIQFIVDGNSQLGLIFTLLVLFFLTIVTTVYKSRKVLLDYRLGRRRARINGVKHYLTYE
ncbi:hypothetical protein PFISCL1PPCAC_24515, partial [Pristionchus fissidentatus]